MANESGWKGAQTEKNSDDFSISRAPSTPARQEKTSDSGSAERGTDDKPKE
ncbi:hypothetical protein ACIU3Q_001041 [Salmonella enterica subsp. enterica serovar Kokomlemle]